MRSNPEGLALPEAKACARLQRADDSGTATEGERRQGRRSGKLPEARPPSQLASGPPEPPAGAAGRGGAGEKATHTQAAED